MFFYSNYFPFNICMAYYICSTLLIINIHKHTIRIYIAATNTVLVLIKQNYNRLKYKLQQTLHDITCKILNTYSDILDMLQM